MTAETYPCRSVLTKAFLRILLLHALFVSAVAVAQPHNTQVHDVRLPERIVDRNPVGESRLPFQPDGRRSLYVWLELIGTKQTLAYLERHDSLSVRAVWRVGLRNTERMEIGIDTTRWHEEAAKIRDQVRRDGFFKWRTFFKKINFEANEYLVFVVDANGNRIRDQQTNKAFELEVAIRRP